MDSSLINLLVIILLILGILGTFLPALPGLLLSFCGLLIYKYAAGGSISPVFIWVFGALTVAATVLSYTIPARTNRKYGGTRWGSIGSFVGTVLGMLFIPVPFGFLIGMLLGVFFGELLHDGKNTTKAFNSMKGGICRVFPGFRL